MATERSISLPQQLAELTKLHELLSEKLGGEISTIKPSEVNPMDAMFLDDDSPDNESDTDHLTLVCDHHPSIMDFTDIKTGEVLAVIKISYD